MSLWGVLSSLLCGSSGSALEERVRQQDSQIKALSLGLIECGREKDALDGERHRLQVLCDEEVARREAAEGDAARFYDELEKSVRVVDVSGFLGNGAVVDPWVMTSQQWRGVQPVLISDLGYYAFPEEDWVNILAPIQVEVKRVLGFPKSEVKDCDNWSLTMCDMVSLAFMRAGLNRQGAFMKLLSKPHSYCGFMLPDYTVKVYEPMSGAVVGWLGATGAGGYGEDTYKTEQAFFLA